MADLVASVLDLYVAEGGREGERERGREKGGREREILPGLVHMHA